ncbi:MAG: hypothetical protein LH650_04945 [Chloroflexi bacterium]|nr:hypothetical protein [Chloroflexota bacterium]
MRYRSATVTALGGSLILTAASLGAVLAQGKGGGDDQPVTLILLVQDGLDRQSEPAALDLARLATELSDGSLTIVPTFDGGDVAAAVKAGTADLGMLPSREWDAAGVTSLAALEAPFLIDNDALAVAVATSPIATKAMDGLSAVGVTGLAMWPEDLRHLFAFGPSGKLFRTPADISGSQVLVVAGTPGHDVITALGGTIYEEGVASGNLTGDRGSDADSGALAGMVTGLWGAGLPRTDVTVAGDAVLYAKYQMLVGNSAALSRLSERQRELLDQIVTQAQEAALGRHFTEADLAAATCASGGTVIEAGPDALAQLITAAAPVAAALATDPVTGGLMLDIEALKASTPASPGAGTCAPPGAQLQPSYAVSDTTGFVGTLLPDGVYRADVSVDDLIGRGADPQWARDNAGLMTWTFQSGLVTHQNVRPAGSFACQGDYRSVDSRYVEITDRPGGDCDLGIDFVWRPVPEGIAFVLIPPSAPWSVSDFRTVQAHLERVWVRVGDAPATSPVAVTLPPNGAYRMQMTAADAEAIGASRAFASVNAGTWTRTFTDGAWTALHDERNEACSGTYSVVGEVVRFVTIGAGACGMDYDVRWHLDGDGLALELVALGGSGSIEDDRVFIERTWTRLQ